MGNLTHVIDDIRPAVEAVQDVPGDRSSKNPDFVTAVALANVRRTVAHIKSSSPILSDLASSGNLRIVGAMQDVSTGAVTFYDWDQNPAILNSPTTTAPSP
jgi:carbonic anhydrase